MTRLSLLLPLLFACVGDVGGPGGGGDDDDGGGSGSGGGSAEAQFKTNVHPILARCQSAACHDITAASASLSHFYDADAKKSYDQVVKTTTLIGQFTSIAPILTKVQAGHQNVSYTPDEVTTITTWLAAESEARKGTTPQPTVDPKQVLREWSGCMSIANFQTAKMAQIWGALASSNQQRCANCHGNGLYGFAASSNEANYFKIITEQSAQLLKYMTVDTVNNTVILNTGSFMNAGVTIAAHPRFDPLLQPNAGPALKQFYDLTLARKTAGQCDPPRLLD